MQDINSSATQFKDVPSSPTYARGRTLLLSGVFALGAGLAASLTTICIMSILRVAAGIPTPVELFSYFVLNHLTAPQFVDLQVAFSPNSKTTPLGLAILGMLAAGTLLGLLYAALVRLRLPASSYRPRRSEWITALAFVVVMTLVGSLLFSEQLRQNQFGFPIGWAMFLSVLGLAVDFGAYGIVLCLGYRAIVPKQDVANNPRQGRRLLLSRAGVAALSVGTAAGTVGALSALLKGYTSYDGTRTPSPNNVTPPITPNDQHYVVTQNTIDPTVNTGVWQLEVTGLVKNPGTYSYESVQQLPSTSRAITLECISNEVGAHLMSTAIWQGVTFKTLLEQHGGSTAGAKYVAFYSVDGYTVSQPLEEILGVDTLLAYRMNGQPLPQRHGYPMRVLIPGHYGEENPKWLTRVELADHFIGGLYSDQGWYNGPIPLTSRIDRPQGHVTVGQSVEVGGIAYGGSKGIQKVEVSTNGGSTWHEVMLQPALSQDAWVLWTWRWTPATAGKYMLVVRATDGTGALQVEKKQGTVPGGSKGYHKVQVEAS